MNTYHQPYIPEDTEISSFSRISIYKWQQFKEIDINFHPRLTILTGANGAGKTTLLNLLAKHFDWHLSNLAMRNEKGKITYNKSIVVSRYPGWNKESFEVIGNITYSNKSKAQIVIADNTSNPDVDVSESSPEYTVELLKQCKVYGLYIPSHRPVYTYQALDNIPVRPEEVSKKKAIEQFIETIRNKFFNIPTYNEHPKSAAYLIKQTLTAWSAFGYSNTRSKGKKEFVENFERFETILKTMLPESLKFNRLKVEDGEVILDCATKPFYIDSSSGGIASIIDIAWQIFMYHEDKDKKFTVIIDEIENHLHPALQRQILPKLISAFPNVKFIISTHSPLMINSVRDSYIYALRYVDGEVLSLKLDLQKKAKSSSQILDEVLGVSFSMPVWAETIVDNLVEKIDKNEITESTFKGLRRDLSKAGLEDLVPEAIEKIVKED